MKKLGLFLIAIFISLQTSAFAHDGENELEQNKIFNGIENYDVNSYKQGCIYVVL